MAINIFNGSSSKRNSGSAGPSSRAQAAQASLQGASGASEAGTTAVGAKGILGKIGSLAKKALPVAAKFLPGVTGLAAKAAAGIFNDPEWWQSCPGSAITVNDPLSVIKVGEVSGIKTSSGMSLTGTVMAPRAAWLSMISVDNVSNFNQKVLEPTEAQITQYLLPEIRKVVNAVPLQSASAYSLVLSNQATIYAIWRNLKKFDFMLKHGQTYLPNMNDPAFPILQVASAAWLQSTINRLEEYLRANVRLPHTLCEYLAWRYGRVYKSNQSAKSALVTYDVTYPQVTTEALDKYIQQLMNQISDDEANQKANADLYNVYFDHDLAVEIADDTQFKFDYKEWMLRSNCDFEPANTASNEVIIDSDLDNPTTFMASTVSTLGSNGNGSVTALIPVRTALVFYHSPGGNIYFRIESSNYPVFDKILTSERWFQVSVGSICLLSSSSAEPIMNATAFVNFLARTMAAKAVDLYNCMHLVMGGYTTTQKDLLFDISTISIDAGQVPDDVLGNEHVFAFANLVNIDRKNSLSYKAAEKLVARDVANTIEGMDVAIAAPATAAPATSAKQ